MAPESSPEEHVDPSSSPPRQRLFFAWWPDAEAQKRLYAIGEQALSDKRGRLVQAGRIHLTLAFLGPVAAAQADCVRRVAAAIPWQPTNLVVDELGWFTRSRVMWAGSSSTPSALVDLVSTLQEQLQACGFTPERRRYHAHLTLARKVRTLPAARQPDETLVCPIDRFHLVESTLDREGASYRILATFPANRD